MTGEIRGISDPDKTGSISVSQCASINREILPGDVGGTIADQELSHCTEIPGIAERMNRHSCEDRGFSFWSHDLLVHLTREPARRDAVDTDVVVCPLDGEPACQTADLLTQYGTTSVKPRCAAMLLILMMRPLCLLSFKYG